MIALAQTLLPDSYSKSTALLDTLFAVPGNFGIIRRALCIGGEDAVLYFSEGLSDTAVTERVLAFCMEFCPTPCPIPQWNFAHGTFPLLKRRSPIIPPFFMQA